MPRRRINAGQAFVAHVVVLTASDENDAHHTGTQCLTAQVVHMYLRLQCISKRSAAFPAPRKKFPAAILFTGKPAPSGSPLQGKGHHEHNPLFLHSSPHSQMQLLQTSSTGPPPVMSLADAPGMLSPYTIPLTPPPGSWCQMAPPQAQPLAASPGRRINPNEPRGAVPPGRLRNVGQHEVA